MYALSGTDGAAAGVVMGLEIRNPRPDEMGQLGLLGAYVFAGSFGDGEDNLLSQANRPEWTLAAFDGDALVSSCVSVPFTMRAHGKATPLSGITAVGTLPEYRRRGLLRAMMTRSFAESRERGQGVAALWASQAAIYQRYGFACVTRLRGYSIDTVDIAFANGDAGSQPVARVPTADAYEVLKHIYIDFIAARACYLHRGKQLWMRNILEAPPADGPVHVAVSRDSRGTPRGYVAYTLRAGRVDDNARSQGIDIRDLVALDMDAYRSLWRFLGLHDLVGRVSWARAPADDPAFELLMEPRRLNVTEREGIWLRIIDIAQALAGRGYAADGELTLSVGDDDLAPWNAGTFRLRVAGGDAEVATTTTTAQMRLTLPALAALYAGWHSAGRLAAWGLLEADEATVAQAEHMFRPAHAPHCPDHF